MRNVVIIGRSPVRLASVQDVSHQGLEVPLHSVSPQSVSPHGVARGLAGSFESRDISLDLHYYLTCDGNQKYIQRQDKFEIASKPLARLSSKMGLSPLRLKRSFEA